MAEIPGLEDGSLPEVLEVLRKSIFTEMCVALPGVVVKYDTTTRQADVQPLIMRRWWKMDFPESLSIIPNVPVMHPQTQAGALILPVAEGDPVTLIFSDRSLDEWKESDGSLPTEAQEQRKHELSDCWAIPGGWPKALPFMGAADGNLALQVKPETKIYIGNGSEELLAIVDATIDIVDASIDHLDATIDHLDGVIIQLDSTLTQISVMSMAAGNIGYPTSTPVNTAAFIIIQGLLGTEKSALAATKSALAATKNTLSTIKTNLGKLKVT